jgi:hypothetical protein
MQPQPQRDTRKRLRKTLPLFKPHKVPQDIVGDFSEDLHRILSGWERNKHFMMWDAYAAKIKLSPIIKQKMSSVLKECRLNGFVAPYIDGKKINWHQGVQCRKGRGIIQFHYEFGDFT